MQSTANKYLNPYLYALLRDHFGSVVVSSQGIAFQAESFINPFTGEKSTHVISSGEYYCVACPFCNDTKQRLWINHMWGQKDAFGKPMMWLAHCYNEHCLSKPGRAYELYERLMTPGSKSLGSAPIRKGRKFDPNNITVEWPGLVTRVDQLPRDHMAVQYLISRKFAPEKIGRFYNVHYCETSRWYLAKDRLIIPIYSNKKLMGWQARYIGEMDWKKEDAPPKYWTMPGMQRRELVYNLRNASRYVTGVIAEGPTDVWSFGPMAVCTLGSSISPQQISKFVSAFRNRSAVLLYDPDVRKDKNKWLGIKKRLTELKSKLDLAIVWLPEGRDPGSLDREWMRGYVTSEAKKQGVHVSWKKRMTTSRHSRRIPG